MKKIGFIQHQNDIQEFSISFGFICSGFIVALFFTRKKNQSIIDGY